MATVSTQNRGTTVIKLLAIASVMGCTSPTLSVGKRHAYIHAIPFSHMKLNAPILTSLTNASPRQCGLQCLHLQQCQSFNYHWATQSCQLLDDHLCSDMSELVYAGNYRYYDVEKGGTAEDVSSARADTKCRSDARCSPKCTCTTIGFSTYLGHYLTPDDALLAAVAQATDKDSCMTLCMAKPLPLCRGVNTNADGSQCQHLAFLPSERSPARYATIGDWNYHRRKCV